MSGRMIGPRAEWAHVGMELPDGTYISAAGIDREFWHSMLTEFDDSPLRRAGDTILASNS